MQYFFLKGRQLIFLMLLLLTFGCKGTQVMSEETNSKDNLPEAETSGDVPSIPALEKFIFVLDEYTAGVVPRNLAAPEVAKFLNGKIEKTTALKSFTRVESAAKFYETFEVVEKFKGFLDKKESGEEDVRRSIVIARIIAYLGTAEDVAFAAQYYKYLIGRAESESEFEDLVLLHEVLGLGSNSGDLNKKLQSKIASLETKKDSDFQAGLQYQKFKESIGQKLYRAEKVQPIKDSILKTADRKKRLEAEIKAYLSLEYGFLEYLQPWAAGRIRRETWAANPAEQIRRNDKAPLKEDVAQALRDFLGKIDKIEEIEPEDKESIRIRLLRAIKFFDGKISAEEEVFLSPYKGKQLDVLANEGFQLP